jgi:hypothetical protein
MISSAGWKSGRGFTEWRLAMKLRRLTKEEVTFRVGVTEEFIPIQGNAQASGDDASDREVENEILLRRAAGDIWAWAIVKVEASWKNFSEITQLGACSYDSEQAFRESGYYEEMCNEALSYLQEALDQQLVDVEPLIEHAPELVVGVDVGHPSSDSVAFSVHDAGAGVTHTKRVTSELLEYRVVKKEAWERKASKDLPYDSALFPVLVKNSNGSCWLTGGAPAVWFTADELELPWNG